MSYIGNSIVSTDFPVDYFSGNGSTTAFTLSIAPASVNAVDVLVSGVSQSPQTYTISGTTLTFSAAPPSGLSNIVVKHRGIAGVPNVPSAGSVTDNKLSLLTPALGTPSAINLSNATSLALGALPSGSVIQTVYATGVAAGSSGTVNTTTPTAISNTQISITTKMANSKIYVTYSAPCQLNNGSAVEYAISWRNSTDSYATDSASVYPAIIESGWYELPSHFATWSNPSQPAGTTITYKLYAYRKSGSGTLYLVDAWGFGGSLPIVAMEIAP